MESSLVALHLKVLAATHFCVVGTLDPVTFFKVTGAWYQSRIAD